MPHLVGSKPRPRSAGNPKRPLRDENISELVRFFQTANDDLVDSLPASTRPEGTFSLFKVGHRRLRQLAQSKGHQRLKDKAESPNSYCPFPGLKVDGIDTPVALAKREWLPSSRGEGGDSFGTSCTKRGVELNGPLRLASAVGIGGTLCPEEDHQRRLVLKHNVNDCGSQRDFGELAAMVEVSLAFPDDEADPPPVYQQRELVQPGMPKEMEMCGNRFLLTERDSHLSAHTNNEPNTNKPSASALVREQGKEREQISRLSSLGAGGDPQASGVGSTPDDPTLKDSNNNNNNNNNNSSSSSSSNDHDNSDSNKSSSNNARNDRRNDADSLAIWLCTTGNWEHGEGALPYTDPKDTVQIHHLDKTEASYPWPYLRATDTMVTTSAGYDRNEVKNCDDTERRSITSPFLTTSTTITSHKARPIPLKDVVGDFPVSPSSLTSGTSSHPMSRIPLVDKVVDESSQGIIIASAGDVSQLHSSSPSHIPIQPIAVTPILRVQRSGSDIEKHKSTAFNPIESQAAQITDSAPHPPPTKPLPARPHLESGDHATRDQIEGLKQSSQPERLMPGSTGRLEVVSMEKPIRGRDDSTLDGPGRAKHRKCLASPVSLEPRSCPMEVTDHKVTQQGERPKSPGPPELASADLQKIRRARSEKVRALRMRDIVATQEWVRDRHDGNPTILPDRNTAALKDDRTLLSDSRNTGPMSEPENSQRNASARLAPSIPLPADPPVSRHPVSYYRRATESTSSSPRSTTHSAPEPSISSANSTQSMSVGNINVRHVTTPNKATRGGSKSRPARSKSPSLPSSDDDGSRMRTPSTRATQRRNASQKRDGNQQVFAASSAGISPLGPRSTTTGAAGKEHSPSESQCSRNMGRVGPDHVRQLEARVTFLERQNKLLQAALFTALDIGLSYNADCIGSGAPSNIPPEPYLGISPRGTRTTRCPKDPVKMDVDEIGLVQELLNDRRRSLRLDPQAATKRAIRSSVEIRNSQRASLEALEKLIKDYSPSSESDGE